MRGRERKFLSLRSISSVLTANLRCEHGVLFSPLHDGALITSLDLAERDRLARFLKADTSCVN
jgi:hypothetical protein